MATSFNKNHDKNHDKSIHEIDHAFAAWLDEQDRKDLECMLEDGYCLARHEDEQDGLYERKGSNDRW